MSASYVANAMGSLSELLRDRGEHDRVRLATRSGALPRVRLSTSRLATTAIQDAPRPRQG